MIREVQLADAQAITDIYNYYVTDTVVTFEEVPIDAADMSQRITKIATDNLPWYVAEDENGQVIGYAYAAKWHQRFSYRFATEVTVYLRHDVQAKGYGTKLYQTLFTELKARGIHTAISLVTLPNDASIALHEKFGFEKAAHFKEVGWKFEQWLDVGYWQGFLK